MKDACHKERTMYAYMCAEVMPSSLCKLGERVVDFQLRRMLLAWCVGTRLHNCGDSSEESRGFRQTSGLPGFPWQNFNRC